MNPRQAEVAKRVARLPAPLRVPLVVIMGFGYIIRRAATTIRWPEIKHLWRHALRVLKFASVGLTVFAIGVVLLYVFRGVLGLPSQLSYLLEAGISVELNFLGSRYITWRDRRAVGFWRSWLYFHAARVFTFGLNQGLFYLQVSVLGLPYWVANIANVIVGAAFNYSANDKYAFAPGEKQSPEDHGTIVVNYPKVSIIIPCKNNPEEIADVLNAIDRQTYVRTRPRNVQVILVGDPNDSTWRGIGQFRAGAAINIVEVEVDSPGRDANAKRQQGMIFADGKVLVFMDADVTPPEHWLANIVALLTVEGEGEGEMFVAGPLLGLADTFMGRFIDRTASGSKTPRVDRPIRLTPKNIGEFKPPVTANLALRREVWERIHEPRPDFTNSYEDYEYAWRALRAGFTILITPLLIAHRYHRQEFRKLEGEYQRSGRGGADFMVEYPESPFAVFRLVQLLAIPAGVAVAAVALYLWPVVALDWLAAGLLSLILTNLLSANWRPGAVLYPFIGMYFSLRYVYGVCQRFVRYGFTSVRLRMPWVGQARTRLIVNNRPSEWRYVR